MSPALYAFILAAPAGVSRPAIARWARANGRSAEATVEAMRKAVRRGELAKRAGSMSRCSATIVYYVPAQWHRERAV